MRGVSILLMRLLTLLMLLCATLCYAQEKEPINRTWTSIAGTKVDAELVSFTDREVVLKLKQGKTIKLALNKLAEYDRYFLKGLERVTLPKDAVKEYELKVDVDELRRGKVITRKNGKPFTGISYRMHSKSGKELLETRRKELQEALEKNELLGDSNEASKWTNKIWSITTYKKGVPNGLLKIFHQNGQKKAEGNADRWGLDSRGDGLWIFWDETGKIITAKSYKDGEVVKGSDKHWNSKGEPVATAEESRK